MPASQTLLNEIRLLFPQLPAGLIQVFADAYVEYGDPTLALAAMRADPTYDTYFPGNRRTDGTLRYTETEYATYHDRFRYALLSVNVNPDFFEGKFAQLVAGDVSINEFGARVDTMYERVIDRAPEIRDYYSSVYGVAMSDSALVASAIDPDVGQQIFERRISVAEIGGEAALRGFGIELGFAERIYERGIDRGTAGQVFAAAAEQLPILDVLARRHNDPDDTFNLEEFTAATLFDDPFERTRIRRLLAQEASMFSPSTGFATQGRAVTGLQPI